MVFDLAVGKALLVGGRAAGPYPADAWLWDGANWTQLTGAPRFGNVNAVYDEAHKVVVVYGEFTSSGNPLYSVDHFTWTWDGSNWSKQSPAHMPPPRSDAQMCYDEQSQTTLLFGGYAVEALGDTWGWNGNDWNQVHPASSPPERWGAALMCGGGRVVLAGGDVRHAPAKDVWSWEGYNWTELTKSSLPDGLSGGAAVFDGTRFVVLLGIQESMPQHAEVWSFDGTNWSTAALS
jgi:hypothetical protein